MEGLEAVEVLVALLQRLGEKDWRSSPSRGGTEDVVVALLQRLGEKDWRSTPSRG